MEGEALHFASSVVSLDGHDPVGDQALFLRPLFQCGLAWGHGGGFPEPGTQLDPDISSFPLELPAYILLSGLAISVLLRHL